MVVANLLQKHQAYVSMARGGFTSLMEYLTDVGIDLTEWIVGAERPAAPGSNASGKSFRVFIILNCKWVLKNFQMNEILSF